MGAELPEKVILDNVEYQNQWLESITRNFCVAYSTSHWSNEENFQEWSEDRILWKDLWLYMVEEWTMNPDVWAYVSDWPKAAAELWYLEWYAIVKTEQEIKDSIYNKRPVVVWSNQIDWSKWYNDPYVLGWDKGSAHAVVIIWYDDNYEGWCFVIKNSYGDERYDWGKMYLPYRDVWLLFSSKYSLIDKPEPIINYKKEIMDNINIPIAKAWYELGLWNGENPELNITREEAVAVITRALEKLYNGEMTKEQINTLIAKYDA